MANWSDPRPSAAPFGATRTDAARSSAYDAGLRSYMLSVYNYMGSGVLLTGITLMTCGSLIGRNTVGVSIVGAFELTGVAAGAAIALFMPLCQLRRGNIIVDFFTAKLRPSTNDKLDRLGAVLLAAIFALLAWRTSLGGWNSYSTNSETQIMGFPEWTTYASMVPAFVLAGLIALCQAALGFDGADEPEAAI